MSDKPLYKNQDLISTGSTLLDLACSGKTRGGFIKGYYFFFVGDSASGKTWVVLNLLAEAANNKHFENCRLIHDDAEGGALMDKEKYFGSRLQERLEPPRMEDGEPIHSRTVEEFYFNLDDAVEESKREGRPFIYILDSMDALDTEDDAKKFQERKTAHRKGKEVKGSYGMSKAKMNSSGLRRIVADLRDTGSILVVICQTRDNVDQFSLEKKTRAGGRSLRFYATCEIWTSIKKRLKKTVKGKPRPVGIICQAKVKKNRLTGKDHTISFPIYNSYGIDNIGGCIDYLVEEGHWKANKGTIKAPEFEYTGDREGLIKLIEEGDRFRELRQIVGQVWQDIEEATKLKRKPRYE